MVTKGSKEYGRMPTKKTTTRTRKGGKLSPKYIAYKKWIDAGRVGTFVFKEDTKKK